MVRNNGNECVAINGKGELIVACVDLCIIGGNCHVFGKDFILGDIKVVRRFLVYICK